MEIHLPLMPEFTEFGQPAALQKNIEKKKNWTNFVSKFEKQDHHRCWTGYNQLR